MFRNENSLIFEPAITASGNKTSDESQQHEEGWRHPTIKGNGLIIRPAVGTGCEGPASHVIHLIMPVASETREKSQQNRWGFPHP